MAEQKPHEHGMSIQEAQRRLNELRQKESAGNLTVAEAGEITRLLVIIGEGTGGEKAA